MKKNWKTTVVGVTTVAITAFVVFGKIGADEAEAAKNYVAEIVSGISGLILIFFANDPKTEGE